MRAIGWQARKEFFSAEVMKEGGKDIAKAFTHRAGQQQERERKNHFMPSLSHSTLDRYRHTQIYSYYRETLMMSKARESSRQKRAITNQLDQRRHTAINAT